MGIRSLLPSRATRRGFTLIELLLVIGIIALLPSIVIVAINPTKQLGDARDSQRRSDVNTLLNALYQYSIDNNGNFPNVLSGSSVVTGTDYQVCQSDMAASSCTIATGYLRIESLTGSYITDIPKDPRVTTTGTGTHYFVTKLSNNRLKVCAKYEEQATADICVTK